MAQAIIGSLVLRRPILRQNRGLSKPFLVDCLLHSLAHNGRRRNCDRGLAWYLHHSRHHLGPGQLVVTGWYFFLESEEPPIRGPTQLTISRSEHPTSHDSAVLDVLLTNCLRCDFM